MAAWGIYDKENHEFTRHYSLYYDEEMGVIVDALESGASLSEKQAKFVESWFLSHDYDELVEAAEPYNGWQLFKYDTELEAIIDHQERFRGYSNYEIMELPADEPEWVF